MKNKKVVKMRKTKKEKEKTKNLVELLVDRRVVLAFVVANAVGARLHELARARTAALRRQVLVDNNRQISLKKTKDITKENRLVRSKKKKEKQTKKETNELGRVRAAAPSSASVGGRARC